MAKNLMKSGDFQPPDSRKAAKSTTQLINVRLKEPHTDGPGIKNYKDKTIVSLSFMEEKADLDNRIIDDYSPKTVRMAGTGNTHSFIPCTINSQIKDSKKKLANLVTLNLRNGDVSLADLEEDFDALCILEAQHKKKKKKLLLSQQVALEACKQAVIEAIQKHLSLLTQALNTREGCEIHIMTTLPKNTKEFSSSYILIGQQLYYINLNGTCEPVPIENHNLFKQKLDEIQKKVINDKLQSDEQTFELITLNEIPATNNIPLSQKIALATIHWKEELENLHLSDTEARDLITSNGRHLYEISLSQKIAQATSKQKAIEAIREHLTLLIAANEATEKENERKTRYWRYLKKIAFFLLLGSGLGVDSFGSFEGADALFQLIPGMIDPVSLGMSIGFSLINSILFVAFEGGMLQDAFGISLFGKAERDILHSQIHQIENTEKINSLLLDPVLITKLPNYEKFAKVTAKFNNNALEIKNNFTMPTESKARKALRYFITGFGALMFSGWACYTAYGILGAALLASGPGAAIVAAVIISSLVYYYVMQARGVNEMMNPTMGLSRTLNDKIETFQLKNEETFTQALDKENIYKKYKRIDTVLSEPISETKEIHSSRPTVNLSQNFYAARPTLTQQESSTKIDRDRARSQSYSG